MPLTLAIKIMLVLLKDHFEQLFFSWFAKAMLAGLLKAVTHD